MLRTSNALSRVQGVRSAFRWTAILATLCPLTLVAPRFVYADVTISDLERESDAIDTDAQSLYRIDGEGLNAMWEAYCGELDPNVSEDRQFAAEIGVQYQQRDESSLRDLISRVQRLQTDVSNYRGPEGEKANQIGLKAKGVEEKATKLQDGVVLKGSNHPFVQYAIEYGKRQHENMCNSHSGPKACNQGFSGANGRPDLVIVEGGHLMIYEFKPNNSKAIDKGRQQLDRYTTPVANFYSTFFQNGQTGATEKVPDSDHGGEGILQALKDAKSAWSDDGKTLVPVTRVETYSMCEKRFGN